MKKTPLPVVVLLLAPLFLVAATSSAVYDPWSDLNADGEIDIFDVVTVASAYRTTGDPTKSVYVQNWPATTQQIVWYHQTVDDWFSDYYNASGFGHMHLIWDIAGLTGDEAVTVHLRVMLYYPGGNRAVNVQSTDITAANDHGGLSFPVPAEIFYFSLDFATGTTATVYLAFYLTYA